MWKIGSELEETGKMTYQDLFLKFLNFVSPVIIFKYFFYSLGLTKPGSYIYVFF